MRPVLLACLLLAVPLVAEELDLPKGEEPNPNRPEESLQLSANRKYFKAMDQARGEYRKRLASILDHADSVEIYLLDFSMAKGKDEEEAESFPIRPYKESSRILARRKIEGEALAEFRKASAELLISANEGGGALCHYPIHGIRFLKGENILFQTSLCWMCQNFFVIYPDDEDGSWVGIGSDSLRGLLMKEMPVPQGEMDRFKKTVHGK